MKAPFIYEGTTPVIEIVREVRLYKIRFEERKSYSVGIKFDSHDAFDFKALESRMIELACEGFPKESFKLIKKNKKGDDKIYCKASTDMSGKPQKVGCRVSGRKTSYGDFETYVRLHSFMRDLRSVYHMLSKVKRVDSLSKSVT